jgi:hypothetical protein
MGQDFLNSLPDYTITMEVAQGRIQTYNQNKNNINTGAFTMRLSELANLCNRVVQYDLQSDTQNPAPPTPVNAIRFYLGAEPDNFGNLAACLICVPVSGFVHDGQNSINGGQDIFSLRLGSFANEEADAIYDFSFPCPTTCATNPILMQE